MNMRKVYYLSTCSTCQRILKELQLDDAFVLQDIKHEPITEEQIDEMIKRAGSAESLFSRRAMKYRSMKLGERSLSESDYRQLILDEYTFLKRPVFLIGDEIFVGSQKKTIDSVRQALTK